MVKIAIAGGSGNVGQEILEALVATKKHDILILSRTDAPAREATPNITWIKTDYKDSKELSQRLQEVHTLPSFASEQDDPSSPVQKRLIDAAVQAGVKRFAPSEWATSGLEHLGWYAYKAETRRYLEELNKDKKVLEYTLFQPGLFMNYLTFLHKSTKHLHLFETPFDFENRRAILIDGSDDDQITFTTVHDLANVVAMAIDFEAERPVIGGIRGTDISIRQLIALGEKVRGGPPFHVEKLKAEDLENGSWQTVSVAGILLAISANAFAVSDEWNRLLSEYKFTQIEDYLTTAWSCKP